MNTGFNPEQIHVSAGITAFLQFVTFAALAVRGFCLRCDSAAGTGRALARF
jgi:hypothetical protein